jgi:hypothetical protein
MPSTRALRLLALLLCVLILATPLGAQDDLQYQKRANRYEGIKPKPVSGFDIELLAAQVDYRESIDVLGDRLRIRFYLDQNRPVHLVVRELDYKYFYWLDKIEPRQPWRMGFDNVFEWPTGDVLKQLRGMQPYQLAVVARLDKPTPSADESVAPVVLYQGKTPSTAKGYVFYFRLREQATVKAAIYSDANTNQPIYTQEFGKQDGERPFAVRWSPTAATRAGRYRLVLQGRVLSTNDSIVQVVRFYHQPEIAAQ